MFERSKIIASVQVLVASVFFLCQHTYAQEIDVNTLSQNKEAWSDLSRLADFSDSKEAVNTLDITQPLIDDFISEAQRGNATAQTYLGLTAHYSDDPDLFGGEVEIDPSLLLSEACQVGEASACSYFAELFSVGENEKISNLQKGCAGGSAYGCDRYAWALSDQNPNVNLDMAISALENSCSNGYQKSCTSASVLHDRKTVPQFVVKKPKIWNGNNNYDNDTHALFTSAYGILISAKEDELEDSILLVDEIIYKLKSVLFKLYLNDEYSKAANLSLVIVELDRRVSTLKEKVNSSNKSAYGRDDSIEVVKLKRRIARLGGSTVGISIKGYDKPHCSGLFLKPDTVLTAAHCLVLDGKPIIDRGIQVFFDYEIADQPNTTKITVEKILAPNLINSKRPISPGKLDYVFFKLGVAPKERTSGKICLQTGNMSHDDPLFGFGYPNNGTLKFHANGSIYLPHQIEGEDSFSEFIVDLARHEFRRTLSAIPVNIEPGNAFKPGLKDQAKTNYEKMLQLLKKAYRPLQNTETYRLGHVKALDRSPGLISTRIELDLSAGDSGAPIFDAATECVIGILKGGRKGTTNGLLVGWNINETVVPISEIISDLESTKSDTTLIETLEELVLK